MPSSSNTEPIKEKWCHAILPTLYQNVDELVEKMISIMVLCCESLEEYFSGAKKRSSFEVEKVLELREGLARATESVVRQSREWTGDMQFQILKRLLGKLERIYVTSHPHLKGVAGHELDALGLLAELLETLSHHLSGSTLTELHLGEIRATIRSIVCNHLYASGHLHSTIVDRKLDRVLMQFWVL